MSNKRVPLFTRLPEIYRIKDADQSDQLRDYSRWSKMPTGRFMKISKRSITTLLSSSVMSG